MEFEAGRSKKSQIADHMRNRIATGEWEVGEPLQEIFTLANQYGVSFGTVRAAEDILVQEGLLSQIRAGIHTFVIAKPATPDASEVLLAKMRTAHRELGETITAFEAFVASRS